MSGRRGPFWGPVAGCLLACLALMALMELVWELRPGPAPVVAGFGDDRPADTAIAPQPAWHFRAVADSLRYYKRLKDGRQVMCKPVEDGEGSSRCFDRPPAGERKWRCGDPPRSWRCVIVEPSAAGAAGPAMRETRWEEAIGGWFAGDGR